MSGGGSGRASDRGYPGDVVNVDRALAEEGCIGAIAATPIQHHGASRQVRCKPSLQRVQIDMAVPVVICDRTGVTGFEEVPLRVIGGVPVAVVQRCHLRIGKPDIQEQRATGLALQRMARHVGRALREVAQSPARRDFDGVDAQRPLGDEGHQDSG